MTRNFAESAPTARPEYYVSIVAALLIGTARMAMAQSTVTPDIRDRVQSAATTDQRETAKTPPSNQLIWGPITLHPALSYRFLSTDGIQAQPGQKTKTDIHTLSPEIAADIGQHWTIQYIQTWNQYSSKAFKDTTEQVASLRWNTRYEAWTLSAGYTFSSTDSPTVETGRQTKQTSHASNFDALYALNSRYALETSLGQSLTSTNSQDSANGRVEPRTWSIREMVHQQTTPQIDTGCGVEYSYTQIDKSPDMSSLQLQASLTWRPAKIFNAALNAGLEKRHVYSTPSSTETNPVYTASLQFIPSAETQLGVTASHSTSAAILESQLAETTQYGVNFQQSLFKRLLFSTQYRHQDTAYKPTRVSLETPRKDKIDAVSLGLSTTFLNRLKTSLSYQYFNIASNAAGYKLSSNQYGFEIGYRY